MSKASNHIKWRLDKAKKEIEKGETHKGIVKIKSNKEEALKYSGGTK